MTIFLRKALHHKIFRAAPAPIGAPKFVFPLLVTQIQPIEKFSGDPLLHLFIKKHKIIQQLLLSRSFMRNCKRNSICGWLPASVCSWPPASSPTNSATSGALSRANGHPATETESRSMPAWMPRRPREAANDDGPAQCGE